MYELKLTHWNARLYAQETSLRMYHKAPLGTRVLTAFGAGILVAVRYDNIHVVQAAGWSALLFLAPDALKGTLDLVVGDTVKSPSAPELCGFVVGYQAREGLVIIRSAAKNSPPSSLNIAVDAAIAATTSLNYQPAPYRPFLEDGFHYKAMVEDDDATSNRLEPNPDQGRLSAATSQALNSSRIAVWVLDEVAMKEKGWCGPYYERHLLGTGERQQRISATFSSKEGHHDDELLEEEQEQKTTANRSLGKLLSFRLF
ncbi:unnamed protein product [Heterosigma akashiwo]